MSNNKLIIGAVAAVAALAVGGFAYSNMSGGSGQTSLSIPAAAQAEEVNLLPDIPLGGGRCADHDDRIRELHLPALREFPRYGV